MRILLGQAEVLVLRVGPLRLDLPPETRPSVTEEWVTVMVVSVSGDGRSATVELPDGGYRVVRAEMLRQESAG